MRAAVPLEKVAEAVQKVSDATVQLSRIRQSKTLTSNYEIVGVVLEEMSLYTAAMMRGDQAACQKKLIDVARAATFGVACQLANTVEA